MLRPPDLLEATAQITDLLGKQEIYAIVISAAAMAAHRYVSAHRKRAALTLLTAGQRAGIIRSWETPQKTLASDRRLS